MASDDYLRVLEAILSLPFPLGRKALTAILKGDRTHDVVRKHRLDKEPCFGSLSGYEREEIEHLFSKARVNGLIALERPKGKFFRVYAMTGKGRRELEHPTLTEQLAPAFIASPVRPEEERLFSAFDFFLQRYNDPQKKAIVCQHERIICVAGAGSGKTTVLTKRIEFLTRFCGVPRDRILAITFTRKAREEMQRRLQHSVQVETFNSFCEQILLRHGDRIYGKPARMIVYRDRVKLLQHALKKINMDMSSALSAYFTSRQQREKTREQLARLFLNDVFSILDYYANNNAELEDFSQGSIEAKMVYNLCRSIKQEMREIGLRDYSDQLTDALGLFRTNPGLMPRYDYVLVDEYQDVNAVQKELLDTLSPKHLFVVGDPRQSIFGWRGSSVNYILDFTKGQDTETIVLTKNYRSGERIVQLANLGIASMRMPDLDAFKNGGSVKLHALGSEQDEHDFIAEKITGSMHPREEIFVLTRTNRQLTDIAQVLSARKIPHVVRSDEVRLTEAKQGEVTLSTVHAIKGLEADCVFVVGCSNQHFPCLASDHPVLELVKREPLDRDQEELRLFYVALSRARQELHLTYTGTTTKFITNEMRKLLGVSHNATLAQSYKAQGERGETFTRLRMWRSDMSRKLGVPPYLIFPDKTLLALAERQPTDLSQLYEVHGFGPSKVQKYGEAVLEILRE